MALKSIIYKVTLNISDLDRHHYADYSLTLALHPSETETRLMVRLLAFALHAEEGLSFTRGLCVDDEPDLWQHSPGGEIERWIEVGLPSEKRLRKACARAQQVVLLVYGREQQVEPWWRGLQGQLGRLDNLRIWRLPLEETEALSALARRQMQLQCTLQDGQLWLSADGESLEITPRLLHPAAG